MGDLKYRRLKTKEVESLKKQKQENIENTEKRKKIMGEIAFKEWLEKKKKDRGGLRQRKVKENERSRSKHQRPKTSHQEVFLAYSYMKRIKGAKWKKTKSMSSHSIDKKR